MVAPFQLQCLLCSPAGSWDPALYQPFHFPEYVSSDREGFRHPCHGPGGSMDGHLCTHFLSYVENHSSYDKTKRVCVWGVSLIPVLLFCRCCNNHHKFSSLINTNALSYSPVGQKCNAGFTGPTSRYQQGSVSGDSRGESVFLPFPASGAGPHPLCQDPFPASSKLVTLLQLSPPSYFSLTDSGGKALQRIPVIRPT